MDELRHKQNLTTIKTKSELYFDKASKRQPNTKEFTDMFTWLSSQHSDEGFTNAV